MCLEKATLFPYTDLASLLKMSGFLACGSLSRLWNSLHLCVLLMPHGLGHGSFVVSLEISVSSTFFFSSSS